MKSGERGYLIPLLGLGLMLLGAILVGFVFPIWTCPLCDGDGADYGDHVEMTPSSGSGPLTGATFALECIGCTGTGKVSWMRRQRLFAVGETLE